MAALKTKTKVAALTLITLLLLPSIKTGEAIKLNENEWLPCLQPKNFNPTYKWVEIEVEATAYCSCNKCTPGKNITASGKMPSRGTIAAPKHIPFGTVIKLDGLGEFTVQDRGGGIKVKGDTVYIDVWMESHKEALKFGRKRLKGWIRVKVGD